MLDAIFRFLLSTNFDPGPPGVLLIGVIVCIPGVGLAMAAYLSEKL